MSRAALLILATATLFAGNTPVRADSADDAFAVAAAHYSRGRWQAAADEFRSLLENHKQFARLDDAQFYFAESLVQVGQFDEATRIYGKLLRDSPDYRYRKQALYRQGESAFLLKRHDDARQLLGQFQRQYPSDALNAYASAYLGEIELSSGNADRAKQIYTQALDGFPDGPMADQCRFGLGRALELQGDTAGAQRFYTLLAYAEGSELADDASLQLALLHHHAGHHAEAADLLEDFDREHADSSLRPTALFWLGKTRAELNQWEHAASAFGKVAEVDPNHDLTPIALFNLAEEHERLHNIECAQSVYKQILDQFPKDEWADDAQESLVRLAFEAGEFAHAIEISTNFAERFPSSPLSTRVMQWRGRALIRTNHTAEASRIFESLAAKDADAESSGEEPTDNGQDTDSIVNQYLLGLSYLGSRRFADAIDVLTKIPMEGASREVRGGILLARAQAWIGQSNYHEAITPLDEYLGEFSNSPQAGSARRDLIVALVNSQQRSRALDVLNDWQPAESDRDLCGEAWLLVAESCYKQQMYSEAVNAFQRALDLSTSPSTRARSLSGLGWSHFKSTNWNDAEAAFARLTREHPEDDLSVEGRLMQARALEQQWDIEAAIDAYDDVLRRHAASNSAAEALYSSIRLHEQAGRLREAVVLGERLINEHADFARLDAALYQLAWDLDDLGDATTADSLFNRLHRLHPSSLYWADATFRLAERAARADDRATANDLLAQLLASRAEGEIRRHALFLSGQIAANDHRWTDVRNVMEQLLEEYPESELRLPAEYWLAESLFRLGEFNAATPRFASLHAATQDGREAWMAMIPLRHAQLLVRDKQFSEAFAVATKIARRFETVPQQFELDYVLGRCHMSRAELDEARAAFDRVVRSPDGQRTEAAAMSQWMIGETYFLQRRYDEALRAYHRVETLYDFPHWQAAALLQAGKCHELKRQPSEATRIYQQLISQFPTTKYAEQAAERIRSRDRE